MQAWSQHAPSKAISVYCLTTPHSLVSLPMEWCESRRPTEARPHSMSTADSSQLPTIASRSSERAPTKPRSFAFPVPLVLGIASALALTLIGPSAHAHIPVRLAEIAKESAASPIIIDGTISFAVYADFSSADLKDRKKQAVRHVRFVHRAGESLAVEYLIPDTTQMRKMRKSQLPKVTITSPSGKVEQLVINERTRFSKPYLPQDYFYLSRISRSAEPGIYTATITAGRAASALVAIGYKEVPGEILEFGSARGSCPVPITESDAIKQSVADQLIGMKEDVAKLCADSNAWGYRVGERDGEFFALTRDYRIDRITASITKGIITAVQVG